MSLQETTITKSKSKTNLHEDVVLPKVTSASNLTSLSKVNSSTNIENIPKVSSLPQIKSSSEAFGQEDETLVQEVNKENKLTLADFNIPENIKSAYYFVQNFKDTSDPTKIQTLRKSLPIMPSYFSINRQNPGIDYIYLIKDHIRNHRKLNQNHINYIREYLNSEQKIEIIQLYNECCASIVDVLEKTI